jgi:hypothetical protein
VCPSKNINCINTPAFGYATLGTIALFTDRGGPATRSERSRAQDASRSREGVGGCSKPKDSGAPVGVENADRGGVDRAQSSTGRPIERE